MSNTDRDIRKTDSRLLAKLLQLDEGKRREWRPEELGAVFQHQLSAPVEFDLSSMRSGAREAVTALSSERGLLLKSFGDLFQHSNPPVELLELTKDFAKTNMNHPDSPLPPEVATVLYYTSIAAALVRCRQRITQLDDKELRNGLHWVLALPWMDEATHDLVEECIEFLNELEPERNE